VKKKPKPTFKELSRVRGALAEWEMRFHYGTTLSTKSLAKMKLDFALKFGWPALEELVREVAITSSQEVLALVEEARRQENKQPANIIRLVRRPRPHKRENSYFYPHAVYSR